MDKGLGYSACRMQAGPAQGKEGFRGLGFRVEGLGFRAWNAKKPYQNLSLTFHVPKQYILWPQSTYMETTLRPKYILFGYMDP